MGVRQPVLNRRLVLEARERVPDGAGGYSESWTALGSHWAEVTPYRGRAQEHDTLPASVVPVRIVVRAVVPGRPGRPRAEQRFRDGSEVFRIDSVAESDPAGRYLVCQAVREEVSP